MALTAPARFSATIVDELGTTASTVAYSMVDPLGSLAGLAASAQAWATALDGVTAGQITKLEAVLLPGVPAGIKAAPAAGSRVEQTAVINFKDVVSGHRFGQAIPALSSARILAGKVNLADAAVQALVVLITTATGTQAYATPARQLITQAVDAFISFRKHRKQLTRSSFEQDLDAAHGGV